MMAKKRFSFDDTIEYDKKELTPNNDLHATQFKNESDNKFVFNDEEKTESLDNGDKEVKKAEKKKTKCPGTCFIRIVMCMSITTYSRNCQLQYESFQES